MTLFRLEAPIASFRPYEARDYQETLPLPPPSTVFGCLLSVIGVERDQAGPYVGTELALAGQTQERSTVLRKLRRDPANVPKGRPRVPAFRPDYEELLSDVVIWVRIDQGRAERNLATELSIALQHPEKVTRHGVVSLGESGFMLDRIELCGVAPEGVTVLRPKADGSLSLTVWIDFVDRTRTQFVRVEPVLGRLEASDAIVVGPPNG